MRFFGRVLFCIVVILGVMVPLSQPQPVTAQLATVDRLQINFTEAIAFKDKSPQGVTLRVYFTPLDVAGKPVLGLPVRSNQIIMQDPLDGGPYDSSKAEPVKGATALTLVLDTSGSMGSAVDDLRAAALNVVKNTPNDTFISISTFADKVIPGTKFTADKRVLEETVRNSIPASGGATCLYDAAFAAIQTMASQFPSGRRAVVLLTDGVDEDAKGKPCSQKTLADVIQLANGLPVRVPIYAAAFKKSPNSKVAEEELRNMAVSTGGSFSVQNNIRGLFDELFNAFNAMLFTETIVFPDKDLRSFVLSLVLNNNAKPITGSGTFMSPGDFRIVLTVVPPTATFTPTFTPSLVPKFTMLSPKFDIGTKEFVVTLTGLVNEAAVTKWQFELIGEDGQQKNIVVPPLPLGPEKTVRISLPAGLPSQKVNIRVTAFGVDGSLIAEQIIGTSFTITNTPPPSLTPTVTLTPVAGIVIEGVRYEDDKTRTAIIVSMRLVEPERFPKIAMAVVNKDTNTSPKVFGQVDRAPEIRLDMSGVPAAAYKIQARPISATGEQNGVGGEFDFKYDPPVVIPPTFTLTPTPVVISLVLRTWTPDIPNNNFIFTLDTQNADRVKTYKFEFVNSDTGASVDTRSVPAGPDFNKVVMAIANLPGGKYTVAMRGLNEKGEVITDTTGLQINWVPPVTPTNTPGPTKTPDDIFWKLQKMLENEQQRPIVIGVFGVLIFGLLFIAFVALRPRRKAKTGTDFLASMTGAVDIKQMQAEAKRASASRGGGRGAAPAASAAAGAMDSVERTSAVPHLGAATASITVEVSRDQANIGRNFPIASTPFTLGRKNRDLNFDNDDNVSRGHAEIVFDNGVYMIQDNNSTHGTFVEDRQVPAGTRAPLYNGARIRLGTTTILVFMMQDAGGGYGSYGDSERTNPENPTYR